jgi:hypothetical protein
MSQNRQIDELPPDYKPDPDEAARLSHRRPLDRVTLVLAMVLALLVEAAVFALSPNLTHALFGQPREVYCTTAPAFPTQFSGEEQ